MYQKLNNERKKQLREEYQSGRFTRRELARIFRVSPRTVDYVLQGVEKPFKYDGMNKAVSFDYMRSRGYDPNSTVHDPQNLLTTGQKYRTVARCPIDECGYTGRSDRLLIHLITHHNRYDLEYLLEDV